ncbi:MAG: hypothetical protein ACLQVY_13920 [Limisphaerales bacterium]
MINEDDGIVLEMSPTLKRTVAELTKTGMEVIDAVRHLAYTRPELFTTPADELTKMLATWD